MLGYSQTAQICRNVHMVTSSVLYVQVQVQVLHLWLQMKNTTQGNWTFRPLVDLAPGHFGPMLVILA